MGAVGDDDPRALLGRQAAQVGQPLFRDDDLHVLGDVVDVAGHGHDGRDLAALGRRGRDEAGDVGVARKVARAADAVLDARAHDVGRVDVAVDVGLDQAVHGDAAQTADDLRVVRDFLRAQDDLAAELLHAAVQIGRRLGAEREGGGRGDGQLARVQQVQHPVLKHFGIGGQVLERAVLKAGQHGVGDIAHP